MRDNHAPYRLLAQLRRDNHALYAAVRSYTPEGGTGRRHKAAFTIAFFLVFMGLISLLFLHLCAAYQRAAYVFILGAFCFALPFLSASYWFIAAGNGEWDATCRVIGGAWTFAASLGELRRMC